MEYADSLWAHLGGDAETDVSTQAEVDQWLEKLLDEAEDDNLDTEGVDNEPLVETTWNAAARHIQRREAIMARTATGEPDFIEAARRIVANKSYEMVDGVAFDLFSASGVLQVWEGLNDEHKAKFASFPLPAVVGIAFEIINKTKAASRKTANGGLTCPTCGEPVEPTPSGNYSHVNSLTGPCGIRIMDTAQRPDGTFTDEDDLADQALAGDDWMVDDGDDDGYDPRYDSPDAWKWQSGQTGVSSFARRRRGSKVAASVEIFDESEGYSTTVNVQADSAEAAISEAVRQNPLFCSSGGWAKVDGTTYNWTRTGESDSAGATVSKESWIGDMANRYVDHLFGASRTAVDEAVEHSDIQNVEGTGEDDEEELYDDWVHDESEWVDPETGAIRSQPNPRGGPFFESKRALTSIDDDELIDWEKRRREEEEGLIDPGPLKRQRYQRELKTHIYSDSQRRSR